MKTLNIEQMENLEGGWGASEWFELGCVAGGLALGALSGPAAAAVFSLTVHSCAFYFMGKMEL